MQGECAHREGWSVRSSWDSMQCEYLFISLLLDCACPMLFHLVITQAFTRLCSDKSAILWVDSPQD